WSNPRPSTIERCRWPRKPTASPRSSTICTRADIVRRMANPRATLRAIARQAMLERGFEPDYPPAAVAQTQHLAEDAPAAGEYRDLRQLPWCSIDNDDSRDLDQLSVAETRGN